MKKMKKAIVLTLAAVMVAGILSGCGLVGSLLGSLLSGLKIEDLEGTWVAVVADTREEASALLENIEAYEEEIALADLDSLQYVKVVHFDSDKTYYFGYDVEATKACVRDFYDRYFDALYEGRTTLNEAYGEVFDGMNRVDFQQYYAEIYGYDDYDKMLDTFAESAYNYESLEEPMETGTFRISGGDILCTITGSSLEEELGVSLEDGILTLIYVDGIEAYTRV